MNRSRWARANEGGHIASLQVPATSATRLAVHAVRTAGINKSGAGNAIHAVWVDKGGGRRVPSYIRNCSQRRNLSILGRHRQLCLCGQGEAEHHRRDK